MTELAAADKDAASDITSTTTPLFIFQFHQSFYHSLGKSDLDVYAVSCHQAANHRRGSPLHNVISWISRVSLHPLADVEYPWEDVIAASATALSASSRLRPLTSFRLSPEPDKPSKGRARSVLSSFGLRISMSGSRSNLL